MKRLNWIDILVIVLLVGALAFVGITKLGGSDTAAEAEQAMISSPTLEYVVEITDSSEERAKNAVASLAGDPRELDGQLIPMNYIYNNNKVADAQITDSVISEPNENGLVTLRFTISAKPSMYRSNYQVGNQEIRLGKNSYILKTMSIELTGTIVSVTELGK